MISLIVEGDSCVFPQRVPPLPLEEISPFHVWRRNDTTNTILSSSLLSLEKRDSDLHKDVWETINAALFPAQIGLKDGSVLFLSGDPFTLFASGCVRLPRASPYDSKRRTEKEEEEECPFWIPLMHGILRWKLYNSVSNNLVLCGTSERRVVKIGKKKMVGEIVLWVYRSLLENGWN
ncbi:hypothetical protein LSM04_002496 [Trypanosoma melophagium]|uniref:uncharacterized protein n=1 Tax=Trypanosoma melophagium TaxID=715481 RepID=UPI00351A1A52|nr:hypothetical protein LSM04_002496 [Trypanosoma melophagium]